MPGLWFPTDRFAFTWSYLPQINLKHIASELWKTSAESQCPWNMNQQFTGTPGFSSVTKKRHLHLIFTSHILCHIWWKALGIMGRYFTNCFDLPGGEGGSFSIKKEMLFNFNWNCEIVSIWEFKKKNESKLNNFTFVKNVPFVKIVAKHSKYFSVSLFSQEREVNMCVCAYIFMQCSIHKYLALFLTKIVDNTSIFPSLLVSREFHSY